MTRTARTLARTAVPAVALAFGLATAGTASAGTVACNVYDNDSDGYADVYAFDTDDDGYEDVWSVDTNEDGVAEKIAVDTDGDGYADEWAFDDDEDGYVEAVGQDTTYNGLPDTWASDDDLDGHADTVWSDLDDDGSADTYDSAASYSTASLTYVFAEADGWTYWELDVSYGYSSLQSDNSDTGIASLTGETPDSSSATSIPAGNPAGTALDAAYSMFPALS